MNTSMNQDLQLLENSVSDKRQSQVSKKTFKSGVKKKKKWNSQVKNTGDQLDVFTSRLIDVERHLYNSTLEGGGGDEVDDACVMELLESMTEVKNEYQNLRKDIQEVQQLQKEMTSSLRYQMRAMTQTFNLLKKRIEVNAQKSWDRANKKL